MPAPVHTVVLLASVCAVVTALGWAALSDARRYIIPNAVSLIVIAAFAAVAVMTPSTEVVGAVGVATVALIGGGYLFAKGRIGGGDVKLFASLCLWAGPPLVAAFALVTCVTAFLLSLLMLSPFRSFMPAPSASATAMTGSDRGVGRAMPLGVAIVAGGFYLMARHLSAGR